MEPLNKRELYLVVVIVALTIILVVPTVVHLASSRPDLKIISWHSYVAGPVPKGIQIVCVVNATNDGGAVGNATIRCEFEMEGDQTPYFSTHVTSISPGEIRTYPIPSPYFPASASVHVKSVKLITF